MQVPRWPFPSACENVSPSHVWSSWCPSGRHTDDRDRIGADGGGQGWRGDPCLSLYPPLTLVKIKSVPFYFVSSSQLSWHKHVSWVSWTGVCMSISFFLSCVILSELFSSLKPVFPGYARDVHISVLFSGCEDYMRKSEENLSWAFYVPRHETQNQRH